MSIEDLFPARHELIRSLKAKPWCDVLVVGGGIHGACVAHLAAFNGLRTILLERGDYGGETSSRSSKLAHGGLRYLEYFDFKQVFEGIRAREDLFSVAPHLVQPREFSVPVKGGEKLHRMLLGVGLTLYDAMSGFRHKHRFVRDPDGCGRFFFTDGVMRDQQVVLERIIAARQEGALCLNYMRVERVLTHKNDHMAVHCVESGGMDGAQRIEIEAGVVMNCAGPFVGSFSIPQAHALQRQLVLSRGIHLLFNIPWSGASQVLPIRDGHGRRRRGQYYFVLPYRGLTMVGTTERVISAPQQDPLPRADEIVELMERVKCDVPCIGGERPYYAFSGVRTLCRSSIGMPDSSRLSRRHRWVFGGGVLSLLGGKYTSAALTAHEGLAMAFRLAGVKQKLIPLRGRLLPGAANVEEERVRFYSEATAAGVSIETAERLYSRLGSRARYIREIPGGFEPIARDLLRGEIMVMFYMEQAHTLTDILSRRLELETMPGHGLVLLEPLCSALSSHWPQVDWAAQADQYRQRIQSVLDVLKGAGVRLRNGL